MHRCDIQPFLELRNRGIVFREIPGQVSKIARRGFRNPLYGDVRDAPARTAGRPARSQLEAEQDQAREILRGLGVDPAAHFPPDEAWLDDYR